MIHVCPLEEFSQADYIVTSSGNRISREAEILRPEGLEIPSGKVIIKARCKINCENAHIIVNKFTMICESTHLSPSTSLSSIDMPIPKYIPMTIGTHCYIGQNCDIQSAVIGICCYIEDSCVLSPRTILKDFVYIKAESFVPSDMVIPPFAIVAGNPAKIIGEMPESITTLGFQDATLRYKYFKQTNITTTK